MNKNKFTDTINTVSLTVDSLETPSIKGGGSSSSSVLNRFNQSIVKDIGSIIIYLNKLLDRSSKIADASASQGAALSAPLTTLTTRVDTLLTDTNYVMADFFKSDYVDSGNTTANVDNLFGQVTLPVTSSSDLLVQTDSFGFNQVSSEVSLGYSTSVTTPADGLFVSASDGLDMLLRRGVWVINKPGESVWIKVKAPLQYLGLNPNILEIYPFPAFGCHISDVKVRKSSGSAVWEDIDITYLPGYDSGTSKVKNAGPLKIHLDGEPINEIMFKMEPVGSYKPGLYNLRVLSNTYNQNATLTVQDATRDLDTITIYGKDPLDLALIPTVITTTKARLDLSSPSTYSTPVISRIVMELA
jgi:hypothetical protein